MDAQTAKRFCLLDAIVMVAATAGGFGLGRAVVDEQMPRIEAVLSYAVSVALLLTLALLALNFTRYRAPVRKLASRPGFSAAVAVIVQLLVEFIYCAIVFSLEDLLDPSISISTLPSVLQQLLDSYVSNVVRGSSCIGVVAAVWLVTAMAGCWRPERTWLDRTGRALGVFWFLITIAYWVSLSAFEVPVPAASPFDMPYK